MGFKAYVKVRVSSDEADVSGKGSRCPRGCRERGKCPIHSVLPTQSAL